MTNKLLSMFILILPGLLIGQQVDEVRGDEVSFDQGLLSIQFQIGDNLLPEKYKDDLISWSFDIQYVKIIMGLSGEVINLSADQLYPSKTSDLGLGIHHLQWDVFQARASFSWVSQVSIGLKLSDNCLKEIQQIELKRERKKSIKAQWLEFTSIPSDFYRYYGGAHFGLGTNGLKMTGIYVGEAGTDKKFTVIPSVNVGLDFQLMINNRIALRNSLSYQSHRTRLFFPGRALIPNEFKYTFHYLPFESAIKVGLTEYLWLEVGLLYSKTLAGRVKYEYCDNNKAACSILTEVYHYLSEEDFEIISEGVYPIKKNSMGYTFGIYFEDKMIKQNGGPYFSLGLQFEKLYQGRFNPEVWNLDEESNLFPRRISLVFRSFIGF